jgi:hypothetical protein
MRAGSRFWDACLYRLRGEGGPARGQSQLPLLQLLYTIRSERQLVERLEFDMLFRWFVGLSIDEKVFDASTPRTVTACSRTRSPRSFCRRCSTCRR